MNNVNGVKNILYCVVYTDASASTKDDEKYFLELFAESVIENSDDIGWMEIAGHVAIKYNDPSSNNLIYSFIVDNQAYIFLFSAPQNAEMMDTIVKSVKEL